MEKPNGAELERQGGAAIAGSSPRPSRLLALVGPARVDAWRMRAGLAAERFADRIHHDLDGGLAVPGLVVVFAYGIAAYFHLPAEPWPPALIAVAGLAVAVTVVRRRAGHGARIAATIAAFLVGAAAASLESLRVAQPRLDHERTVTVEGRVIDVDATARGGLRMTLDVARMEGRGLHPETTPTRISATLTARGWRPEVGDGVRFRARLKPPEGPVLPGGYDFARRAWFEGRGAGGYVLGRATPIDLGPAGWTDRLFAPIGRLRHAIAERVRAELPGPTGTIGAALIVGEQRAIPDAVNEPLRASGLTHIVSISGLHMSLVAGGVIVAIRALLALFPGLALGYPIKKWAAAAGFVAITIYLLLSGNQVAALRSHLMLSVALLAVLVERPAITMHTVAVSAALILAVEPSAVMDPSFQMSYLAVIALVASYDLYRLWVARRPPPSKEAGVVGSVMAGTLAHVEGSVLSSLVAGLATAPVIAGVFFRAAPYSIFANMLVLPVTGLVIMPAAVVAALAMPFGLDSWPLMVMGLGIDWMIAVGGWAAGLPGGAGLLGAPHPAMLGLGILAILWLSAWKSSVRLLGIVPAVMALGLLFVGPRPDVLVGRHGAPVAVRGGDGRLHVLGTRQEKFDTAIWLAADADARTADDPTLAEGWRCDPLGCVYRIERGAGDGSAGLEVAVVRHPDGFGEDCRRAALIVTTLVAPPGCRDHTTVIDRIDLARLGAATIDFIGPVRPFAVVRPESCAGSGVAGRGTGRGPIDPTNADDGEAEAPSDTAAPRADVQRVSGGRAGGGESEEPTTAIARRAVGDERATTLDGGREDMSSEEHRPDEPEADPPFSRRDVRIVASLTRQPRPWTPRDPRIERAAREAEAAEAAAVDFDPVAANATGFAAERSAHGRPRGATMDSSIRPIGSSPDDPSIGPGGSPADDLSESEPEAGNAAPPADQ